MSETIICPDGARITCAIGEIAEIMRIPSDFLWLSSVWIPSISALISLGVLIFSVATSRSAKKQAGLSEKARVMAEYKRSKELHADRMRVAFGAIFTSIGELGEGTLRGEYPSDFRVLGDIAAARLESITDQEKRLTERLSDLIVNTRLMRPHERGMMLLEVWGVVIRWFDASNEDRDSLLTMFDDLEGVTPDLQDPL